MTDNNKNTGFDFGMCLETLTASRSYIHKNDNNKFILNLNFQSLEYIEKNSINLNMCDACIYIEM